MPKVDILIYREGDAAPLLDWLNSLQDEARNRCLTRLALLQRQGHELRRPIAENLGGGIYELRVKFYRVNYRMLYFFHGQSAAVVTHGLAKERTVPQGEIDLALERMKKFKQDPKRHTFHPEE